MQFISALFSDAKLQINYSTDLFIHISYMPQLVLGYWKIRGLAQYIRHLLSYSGLDFAEVQYENQEKWFKEDKLNLGLDFPNIPYLLDGDFKLTESAAIVKYIAQRSGKTDLLGKTVQDQGKVDNLTGVLNDALKEIRPLFWNKDYETLKIEKLQKARPKFEFLKNFIGERQFALGYLTIFDFSLAESVYYFETLYPNERKNFNFLWRLRRNLENLPEVRAYYTRPDAVSAPFLPPSAALSVAQPKVKIGYWGIRGLAQIPRLLLSISGVEFQDRRYTVREQWFNDDKVNLGLDFPNLPYLIDGDYNVTESSAIQRYIIKRWGNSDLLGKNIHDNAEVERFLSVFSEVSSAIKGLYWNKEWETAKVAVLEKYAVKLDQLNKFVGEKNFVLGYVTLADFVVAEDSYYIEKVFPAEYQANGFLQKIRENFNKLPEVVAYYEKPTAFKGIFFPPTAAIQIDNPFAEKKEA